MEHTTDTLFETFCHTCGATHLHTTEALAEAEEQEHRGIGHHVDITQVY